MCGEYEDIAQSTFDELGSPPHTWRIHIDNVMIFQEFRITSTYVENTQPRFCVQTLHKDHLHIRGEYYQLPYFLWKNIGSPPHTWRIQDPNHDCMLQYRDHLHIRGEYQLKLLLKPQRRGSPPHVWRILSGGDPVEYLFRITSTYVENTDQVFKLISAMNGITSTYVENTSKF